MSSETLRSVSPEPRICQWGFACTSSFLSGADLMRHLIKDHVRTAVPVDRESIPRLLRVTEGIGGSYDTEHFLSPLPETQEKYYSQGKWTNFCFVSRSNNIPSDSNDSGPAASLPSPPISAQHEHDDGGDSVLSSRGRSLSPNLSVSEGDLDQLDLRSILLSDIIQSSSPRFAALDSPSSSGRPGSLPPSPSFSDIVASSTQKGAKPPSRVLSQQLLASSVSKDSSSSSVSAAMVAEQLIPIDDETDDEETMRHSQRFVAATAAADDEDVYVGTISENRRMASQSTCQLPAAQLRGPIESQQSSSLGLSNFAQSHGSRVSLQPTLHQVPVVDNSSLSPTASRLSFKVPSMSQTGLWYGPPPPKRLRGDERLSPSISPVDSPAISPTGTSVRQNAPSNRSRFSSSPSKLNDSLHRKRYKLNDSSAESQGQAGQPRSNRMSNRHSKLPVSRAASQRDDEGDADVSQMQVETQLTMSLSPQPPLPVQPQAEYRYHSETSNNPLNYFLQSQAPYDSQQ